MNKHEDDEFEYYGPNITGAFVSFVAILMWIALVVACILGIVYFIP